jgi:phosphotransferase system enzyme I (PtsI)
MEIKRGIAVSAGVAIGPALLLETEIYRIPPRLIKKEKVKEELDRVRNGLEAAAREARQNEETVNRKVGKQYGAIFAAHAFLIEDKALGTEIEQQIRQKHFAAEYAVSKVIRKHAKALESLDRGHFAARAVDLYDIEKRILRNLLGHRRQQLRHLPEPVVILAHDLTPSETAALDSKKVSAFVTEAGGRASHTAIMAGALEIPAVVGLGRFLTDVSGGDTVIVDGNAGLVILNPDDETQERYEKMQSNFRIFERGLVSLRDLPAETKDGTRIMMLGNIEFPHETSHCVERGAEGVGLYRTEFLYLDRKADPSEEEQLNAYLAVLRSMESKPVVIRTLDLGADKVSLNNELAGEERNPFLGLRSVRLCLRNLGLFKTQLRAILRASAFGDVRILFPMVSTIFELRQCKLLLAEVKEDLEDERIAFNRNVPIGTMIEVPSAAIMADQMATEVNFFSIGTNDLVQYTLAADRTNETVATLYSPGDPAVLRLIDGIVKAAQRYQIKLNVCGEMSGDPIYTLLLVGMGIRQLSATPHNIPEVKKIIRSVTLDEAQEVAREVMCLETARDVNNYLREKTRRILPEVVG